MAARLRAVESGVVQVTVQPINTVDLGLKIRGTAPLVMNAFPEKAKQQLMAQMSTPKSARKPKSERPPRDYDAEFAAAHHYAVEGGWVGLPANGFRAASIEACRLAGVMMSRAKQGLFLVPDGWDRVDGQALVRLISEDAPERTIMHVRNETGVVDIRVRPMWREWEAVMMICFDADCPEFVYRVFVWCDGR
jgi:hypothetical protein